jgi:antirestriction protein ArdC
MKTNVERMYLESLENAMGQIKFPEAQTQINKFTGRSYRRLNQLILIAKQRELNSKSNEWVSKEQLEELGLKIKEKEFGTQLFSFKLKDKDNSNLKEKVYSYYTVYNLEQLEQINTRKAS